jgi:hypothetical protein
MPEKVKKQKVLKKPTKTVVFERLVTFFDWDKDSRNKEISLEKFLNCVKEETKNKNIIPGSIKLCLDEECDYNPFSGDSSYYTEFRIKYQEEAENPLYEKQMKAYERKLKKINAKTKEKIKSK